MFETEEISQFAPLQKVPGYICLPDVVFGKPSNLLLIRTKQKIQLVFENSTGIFCYCPGSFKFFQNLPFSESQTQTQKWSRWYRSILWNHSKENDEIGFQLHFYLKDFSSSQTSPICLQIQKIGSGTSLESLVIELTFDSASQLLQKLEAESKVDSRLTFYLENGKPPNSLKN